ncbi:MAG: hypothetical protein IT228_04445 [Flavobacteriales bacterium]|nr:hypothetical protein [Flavobacteriales bacterium]MCC6576573.1 hypothetical protein [Flavobacteriales bacterium]NUQ15693.1 hypothetical protein [Flavobacteriales bacterium]
MTPKHLVAAFFCATLLHGTAQVTVAPLPAHAPADLAAALQAALAPLPWFASPGRVTVTDYAEGRHGSGAALVMGQVPALWLVLTVEQEDGLGRADRTELHVQGRDLMDLMAALVDRMEVATTRAQRVSKNEDAPLQARRPR